MWRFPLTACIPTPPIITLYNCNNVCRGIQPQRRGMQSWTMAQTTATCATWRTDLACLLVQGSRRTLATTSARSTPPETAPSTSTHSLSLSLSLQNDNPKQEFPQPQLQANYYLVHK